MSACTMIDQTQKRNCEIQSQMAKLHAALQLQKKEFDILSADRVASGERFHVWHQKDSPAKLRQHGTM